MKSKLILIIFSFFAILACQQKQDKADAVQGIRTGHLSDFVESPVRSDGTIDTVNVAKITFDLPTFDFGEVNEGEIVEHVFAFRNTGNRPLLITNANSTCGCTIPEWPKTAIAPGDTSSILVRFNTMDKPERQLKPVSIYANTYPNETKIYLKGYVKPKQE